MTYYVDELYHGTYPVYSDELYHFGVKGMKWGRRKARSSSKETNKYKSEYDRARTNYQLNKHNRKMSKDDRLELKYQVKDTKNRYKQSSRYDIIRDKKSRGKYQSAARMALENRYKNKGFSDRDSTLKADRFLRSGKRYIGAGLLAATPAGLPLYAGSIKDAYDNVTNKTTLDYKGKPYRSKKYRNNR